MSERPACPTCRAPLPVRAPLGLCPSCLMRQGFDDIPPDAGGPASRGLPRDLPGAGRGSTVLESLSATIGLIPRVLLRDPDLKAADPGPVVRPSSPEMPGPAGRPARLHLYGEIARGGMGAVLKGRDPDLGRDLAVKVLLDEHRESPDMVRRFVEEAQIGGQLQHPGVVPVYELGAFADSRPYFSMKLVKGSTLAEMLAGRGGDATADLPRFLAIFEQVAQTVAYAHSRGVIHRDMKPSNVMVGAFGEVQVMDWGLTKVLPRGGATDDLTAGLRPKHETIIATSRQGGADRSAAGSVLGTPAYMAPEQARGEVAALDERCDVFALGSILCEVLAGAPAFTGRHVGEVQRRAARAELSDAFARLEACGSDPELVGLAEACLAAEREDRPDDASAVAGRLSAHQESVHRRMREAELAHAAEGARVDEAKKTAIAEAMRAEAAEARARAERQARRSLLGLAAAVLALTVMGARGRPGRSSNSATAPPRSRSPCATPPSSATRRKRRPATPGGGRPPRRP